MASAMIIIKVHKTTKSYSADITTALLLTYRTVLPYLIFEQSMQPQQHDYHQKTEEKVPLGHPDCH